MIRQVFNMQLEQNQMLFFLAMLIVMEGVCLYLWRYRKITGAIPLLVCQLSRFTWVLTIVLKSFSPNIETYLTWGHVADYASILMALSWCLFTMQVAWQQQRSPLALRALVGTLSVGAVVLVATDSWHGQLVVDAWIVEQTATVVLGKGYLLLLILAYSLVLLGSAILLYWARLSRGWRRKMYLLLSCTPLFTVFGQLLAYQPMFRSYFPFILASLCAQFYSVYIFYRWRLFSILPFAQQSIMKNMIDGLIVVDEQGYVVDMNPAADEILQGLPAAIGGTFQDVVDAWPALQTVHAGSGLAAGEGERERAGQRRCYQFGVMSLNNRNNRNLGKTILIKDITAEKATQEKIIDQQKALAVLTERNRLGREIHDGDAQIWNYLLLELHAVKRLLDSGKTDAGKNNVERLLSVVRELNDDVRETIAGLKNNEATTNDFASTLQEYLNWYEKTYGIEVKLALPDEKCRSFGKKAGEAQLLRIVQEALTNVRKHAAASQVKIEIENSIGNVQMTIEDNGCGFSTQENIAGKYGLTIMRERAEEAGYRFSIESAHGRGTKITLTTVERGE